MAPGVYTRFCEKQSVLDELTAIACDAVQQLTPIRKAEILLNTALALIEDGRRGEDVERYLDFYLKTPGLPKEDVAKALSARSNSLKLAGDRLSATQQVEPLSVPVRSCKEIPFSTEPACHRIPPELWDQIATHMPKYHLRRWLFVSNLHRDIASRYIFHTVDVFFGGFDQDQSDVHRGFDMFDRARQDPIFANRVKSLRIHWTFEEAWHRIKNILNVVVRIVELSLPAFRALQHFEWTGYPEIGDTHIRINMVQALLKTHKHLHGLVIIPSSKYLSVVGVSAFENLHKLSLCMNHSDKIQIPTLLDRNKNTLKHLTLSADPLASGFPYDFALDSGTIHNLSHLGLVDMNISDFMLSHIASMHNLQSLTLTGLFVDVDSASAVFAGDRIIGGLHSVLPHLVAFRVDLVNKDISAFYCSLVHFLRKREKLRRLSLGRCPWDLVQDVLPDLRNLRVLSVRIHYVSQEVIESLVKSIPTYMVAIRLSVKNFDKPLDEYAHYFTRFNTLSFLHLRETYPPSRPRHLTKIGFRVQIGKSLQSIAATVPSLDFVAWNDNLCVVKSRGDAGDVEIKEIPTPRSMEYGWSNAVDIGEDATWSEQADPVDLGL